LDKGELRTGQEGDQGRLGAPAGPMRALEPRIFNVGTRVTLIALPAPFTGKKAVPEPKANRFGP